MIIKDKLRFGLLINDIEEYLEEMTKTKEEVSESVIRLNDRLADIGNGIDNAKDCLEELKLFKFSDK